MTITILLLTLLACNEKESDTAVCECVDTSVECECE